MKLTVLGKSPAWSDAGGACSGYLVENGPRAVALDCGNGCFGKLRARVEYREVEAVVISHLHGDHVLDLVPFSYALTLGAGAAERDGKPRLLAPAGAGAFFARLAGTWDDADLISEAFSIEEYGPGAELEAGGARFRMHPVPHYGPTHAVEITAPGGGRIFSDDLIAAARGADALIAEATLTDPDPAPLHERGHMSAEEAGRLAREAGVGRLVLTHISDELDPDRAREVAREAFGGPVEVASEGLAVEVP
jgi:ribonuclease BN (tRNA processing enzyme)